MAAKIKIQQLKKVLELREQSYRQDGNIERANILQSFAKLMEGHETKTLDAFAKQIKERCTDAR